MSKDARLVRALALADAEIKKTDDEMAVQVYNWIHEVSPPNEESGFFLALRKEATKLEERKQHGDSVPGVYRNVYVCFTAGSIPSPIQRKSDERKLVIACELLNKIDGLKAELFNNLLRVHWSWDDPAACTNTSPAIKALVDAWPWHGSWFPKEDCFTALQSQVVADKHSELKHLIAVRAEEYNSTLE